jgi:hypothetical protein
MSDESNHGREEEEDSTDNQDTNSNDDVCSSRNNQPEYVSVLQDCHFVAPRKDAFHLPALDGVANYVWAPSREGEIIQTMTDFTLACQKACCKVWSVSAAPVARPAAPDDKDDDHEFPQAAITFFHGICSYHAWNAWHRTNRSKFKKYDKNRKRMGHDFEAYKCSPWQPMVPVLRVKMVEKWSTIYKEKHVARAWFKQWSKTAHTRIEQNQNNLFKGGLPAHNNNAEGRNNGNKIFFDHRKPLTTNFVHHLASMLENRSKSDLKFCDRLHQSVHSFAFYRTVYGIVTCSNFGIATPLTVTFDYRNAALGIPAGLLLIATTYFLEHKDDYFGPDKQCSAGVMAAKTNLHSQLSINHRNTRKRKTGDDAGDQCDAATAMHIVKTMKYHEEYKRLLSHPEASTNGMSFDDVINLL